MHLIFFILIWWDSIVSIQLISCHINKKLSYLILSYSNCRVLEEIRSRLKKNRLTLTYNQEQMTRTLFSGTCILLPASVPDLSA